MQGRPQLRVSKNDGHWVTEWVTEYQTVNYCRPISTTVTVCDMCAPCVITGYTQYVTSTKKSTYPTSTYCPSPGYYDQCGCYIDYPQWIYYDTGCDVEYICPYQDWYFFTVIVVEIVVKINGQIFADYNEQWEIIVIDGITTTITKTQTVTQMPASRSARPVSSASPRRSIALDSRLIPSSGSRSYTVQPASSMPAPASSVPK